jgi:hypothetical protein
MIGCLETLLFENEVDCVGVLSISSLSMVDGMFCPLCLTISQDGDSRLWTATTHTMSHELLRLSSLSTFPRTIDISMIRLARAGFYHTNRCRIMT